MKRHAALKPLSREHHHGLLLSWKIRRGFTRGVEPKRMKKYADWFFKTHLKTHFKMEEKYLFPLLGMGHEGVKKAMAEHRRIERLFKDNTDMERSLTLIEETLENHIRFEERTLFNEIQEKASAQEFALLEKRIHEIEFEDNLSDEFWNDAPE